ncbi:hypothetical protein EI71_01153 [Anaeroplasma bactoclasticum]|jgi:hypothetical protein|uniref:DUF6935 domain-containing protein n=1 Tax=Anaeroplasma bactoclasticum TaxID=2088 RepID=A0A397RSN7_9MOLU|nr:hypothetical protein [Anaeroplasma bactoclasticum]RIA75746.1 hypothetical protein EI71_01153 [Anaeroplasma bactoclasticum]
MQYNQEYTFQFRDLPRGKDELLRIPEASLDSPFKTAALALLVLCTYKLNKEACYEMLNVLRGPEPLSVMDKQFLHDRLNGKEYKPYSFFRGASVDNGYTPGVPYTITVRQNPYSFTEENYAVLWVKSVGADSEREIKLRKKPSTGQWFIRDFVCLADIRIPKAEDPWA